MSNQNILDRLEIKLEEFLKGDLEKHAFIEFLHNSFEALDGISYRTLQNSRDLEYKIDVAEFADEDESLEPLSEVIDKLKALIKSIKQG
ncbi:hypothetical protein K6119_07940 [Paracrocinitomix mangrovi]|uniref:hypothetical protein n=1 Tax=Paracrocinitomix mangrovi TaxID=2862509 RepID=UPI001EDC3DBF|nr:hypothetical protein [Paracrocinitomix mangrovi]UKN03442.1 hypothetical protein K6119_07940 [Paracrocinitomix mangrovi]